MIIRNYELTNNVTQEMIAESSQYATNKNNTTGGMRDIICLKEIFPAYAAET